MAHRILGIDLGSYSVKIAVVAAGFRKTAVVDWLELPLPPPGPDAEPLEVRQARVIGEVVRARGWDHDAPFVSFGGETLSIRVLEFPFHNLKRAELERAVGAELEAQLPHELDEIVYTFDTLPPGLPTLTADGLADEDGAGRAVTAAGMRVLAAASARDRVARLIELLASEAAEPHGVLAAPAAYARVAGTLAALDGADAAGECVMLVDVGHSRTNVCIVARGRTIFARTLSRGGRHVTQAIANTWNMPFEEAELAKHSDGFVASSREPAPTEAWGRISEVVIKQLEPLARELRQTLAACRVQTGCAVTRAVLAGGGSRLRGLASYLGDELDVPVGLVTADDAAQVFGPGIRDRPVDHALLALGVALEGASGRPAFDLRQGPLLYKHDFTFLRARAGYLAACGLAVAAFFAGNAYASLYELKAERDILDKRLADDTTEIFGAPVALNDIDSRLAPRREDSPLPKMTAFDLLVEMSKRLPPRSEGKLDVLELEIEPKKVFIKAIADTSATIDAVQKKLREIECFGDVQAGRVDTVNDGRQFTLTITAKCM